MGPTGYCWLSAAGPYPFLSRPCTARKHTDSYGGGAAAQAGQKNELTAHWWSSAAGQFSNSATLTKNQKNTKNVTKMSFYGEMLRNYIKKNVYN